MSFYQTELPKDLMELAAESGLKLFQNRTKLLSPIQDKVTKAITEVAKAKFFDFIFDKSSEATMMIYASSNYDVSNDVITRLGYKPGTIIK